MARAVARQSQRCRLGHLAAALMSAWFQATSYAGLWWVIVVHTTSVVPREAIAVSMRCWLRATELPCGHPTSLDPLTTTITRGTMPWAR